MTDDAFESQLIELETLLSRIAGGSELLGAASRFGGESDATDTLPLDALEVCTRLVASWKLRRQALKMQPQAETLLRAERQLGRIARTESVDVTEVLQNMPWVLHVALDALLDDSDALDRDPSGGPATVARILASMLDVIEHSETPHPTPCDATGPPEYRIGEPLAPRRRH